MPRGIWALRGWGKILSWRESILILLPLCPRESRIISRSFKRYSKNWVTISVTNKKSMTSKSQPCFWIQNSKNAQTTVAKWENNNSYLRSWKDRDKERLPRKRNRTDWKKSNDLRMSSKEKKTASVANSKLNKERSWERRDWRTCFAKVWGWLEPVRRWRLIIELLKDRISKDGSTKSPK